MNWLENMNKANERFKSQVDENLLPVNREPCPYAVVTCMDPRINLEAIGIGPFAPTGQIDSHVRVIRTIGGLHDIRSLIIGIHLAGFKEIAVIMHTDCGCSLALQKIDTIINNMISNLTGTQFESVKSIVGEPFEENLVDWLGAFEDPYAAVVNEVENIKKSVFIPKSLIVHGIVYDLATGGMDIVINGYEKG
ncbi:MAG: hypothetical protein D3926_19450 [Desulfobacteraceae bacterium]|nr:MAG: hypothetical protein D3926_19450 [Desulfobacteraceae bacterium]